jgi:hypothetical protein
MREEKKNQKSMNFDKSEEDKAEELHSLMFKNKALISKDKQKKYFKLKKQR